MTEYYDNLETRLPEERDRALAKALPAQIAHAQSRSSYFADALGSVDADAVRDRAALVRLPVLRKETLIERQGTAPPFGGLAAVEDNDILRIFQSPGPIYEPQTRREDFWRFGRAMFAAGFRRGGGVIHNTFAYHFTPAGAMFDSAGSALQCPVFPAGTGQTELQVRAISQLRPAYYTGTPSFLNVLLEKADELGEDVSSLSRALVTAEPLPPSLVEKFRARGVEVHQCYGTADLGLIAYETEAREGLVADEGVIIEIVRPGTGEPVPYGEVGEVVVTTLNPDYPLIRFATGDLSAVLPGQCPTGRTNLRIKGWMGRADQTAKVRGMFVHPSQVNDVVKRHPEIVRARLEITQHDHRDTMTLRCEVTGMAEGLSERITESVRELCKLRGDVELVEPDTLANDGKVIDDQRTFE